MCSQLCRLLHPIFDQGHLAKGIQNSSLQSPPLCVMVVLLFIKYMNLLCCSQRTEEFSCRIVNTSQDAEDGRGSLPVDEKQHLPLTQQWAHHCGKWGDYRTRGMVERQCEGYRKKLTMGRKKKSEFSKPRSLGVGRWCCWPCRRGWQQKLVCVTCWGFLSD